jgi:hypothetical protein
MREYNPADYHPPYVPKKRPHTSNSIPVKIWAVIAWIGTPIAVAAFGATIIDSLSPNPIADYCPYLLPASLLTLGSCLGLLCHAASNIFKNPLLRACRKRYPRNPEGLVKADLTCLRIAFPIQSLWALISIGLYITIIVAQNPFQDIDTLYQQMSPSKENPVLYILIAATIITGAGLPFLPLLAGNLLGALPKDPLPDGDPCMPPLDEYSTRTESPWEGRAQPIGRGFTNQPKFQNPRKTSFKNTSQKSSAKETWNNKKISKLEILLRATENIHKKRKNP